MVVPGFPNFYMLSGRYLFITPLPSIYSRVYRVGPNTITGYTSVLFCNEVQVSI
jgi:hypothetical protein